MKISTLFLLIFLIFSCNDKKEKILTCESQREKAKNDFNNKKFIYFEYVKLTDSNNNRQNFVRLLKDNKIDVIFDTLRPVSCIPDSEIDPNYEYCYKEMMNNNLYAKFGHQFFDSLRLK